MRPSEKIFAAVIFSGPIYLTLLSIVHAVVPRVGPESLTSELMTNSFTIPLGLVLAALLFFCIKKPGRANVAMTVNYLNGITTYWL